MTAQVPDTTILAASIDLSRLPLGAYLVALALALLAVLALPSRRRRIRRPAPPRYRHPEDPLTENVPGGPWTWGGDTCVGDCGHTIRRRDPVGYWRDRDRSGSWHFGVVCWPCGR